MKKYLLKKTPQELAIGFVAIIVIIAAAIWCTSSPIFIVSDEYASSQASSGQTGVSKTNKTAPDSSQISYEQALAQYANHRIQLNENCQAYPAFSTYPSNTKIMIDNRSTKTRTIKFGTTFTIQPYGFRIISLTDALSQKQTIYMNCDGQNNIATVAVQ